MSARIYCTIQGTFRGFRELESFSNIVNEAWAKDPRFFPMYDPDTLEIFECSWNAEESVIVAFAEVSVKEFRMRLAGAADTLIKERTRKAIIEASSEASEIIAEAERFTLKHSQK
ncbi:MAG: hypothetical protein IJB16_06760 [Clostridia bacterium]|nr:hypothetical protein [Clostridia bacterium]